MARVSLIIRNVELLAQKHQRNGASGWQLHVSELLPFILNEHRSLPSIAASQLLQESEVRGSVEDGVLPVMETSLPQFNGPKNLHALALSGHGNFRRTTDPAPGGVQGRILAKAGFVGEDQRPVLPLRFFLRLG